MKLPDAVQEALENDDIIRIDVLVREFLQDSALKVLPQNHFEEAIMAYIHAGDRNTMDAFINESLSKSLKYLTSLEDDTVLNDMDGQIERCKEQLQERWSKSEAKWTQTKTLLPQPKDYDSDQLGPWDNDDHPERWVALKPKAGKTKSKAPARRNEDEDVNMDASDGFTAEDEPPVRPTRGATRGGRGGAKKAPAAAKKAPPAAKKAPATRAPPKKRGGFVVESDDEEDEAAQDEDISVAMSISTDDFEDEEDEFAAPAPKRGGRAKAATPAAKTKAAPSRAAAPRAAAKPVASRGRQSKLNFSQSQRVPSSRVNATQASLVISDDEIDDDDDDDAFEAVEPMRRGKR